MVITDRYIKQNTQDVTHLVVQLALGYQVCHQFLVYLVLLWLPLWLVFQVFQEYHLNQEPLEYQEILGPHQDHVDPHHQKDQECPVDLADLVLLLLQHHQLLLCLQMDLLVQMDQSLQHFLWDLVVQGAL